MIVVKPDDDLIGATDALVNGFDINIHIQLKNPAYGKH